MNRHAYQVKDRPRPTIEEAGRLLESRGWKLSAGSWEDENRVFVFSQESYPGTYGGAAAVVTWSIAGGWLSVPECKPSKARFV